MTNFSLTCCLSADRDCASLCYQCSVAMTGT